METSATCLDASHPLGDPAAQREALQAAFDSGDHQLVLDVLRSVIRTQNLTALAVRAGVSRQLFYRMFRPGAAPRLESIMTIMKVLGMRLQLVSA